MVIRLDLHPKSQQLRPSFRFTTLMSTGRMSSALGAKSLANPATLLTHSWWLEVWVQPIPSILTVTIKEWATGIPADIHPKCNPNSFRECRATLLTANLDTNQAWACSFLELGKAFPLKLAEVLLCRVSRWLQPRQSHNKEAWWPHTPFNNSRSDFSPDLSSTILGFVLFCFCEFFCFVFLSYIRVRIRVLFYWLLISCTPLIGNLVLDNWQLVLC